MPAALKLVDPGHPQSVTVEGLVFQVGVQQKPEYFIELLKSKRMHVPDTVQTLIRTYFTPSRYAHGYRMYDIVTPASLGLEGRNVKISSVFEYLGSRRCNTHQLCSMEAAILAQVHLATRYIPGEKNRRNLDNICAAISPMRDAQGRLHVLILGRNAYGEYELRSKIVDEDTLCAHSQLFFAAKRYS